MATAAEYLASVLSQVKDLREYTDDQLEPAAWWIEEADDALSNALTYLQNGAQD